jgi:tetratricopeptide (TPR) repeat protein
MLRLVGALWTFWRKRAYLREGRQWAEEALALGRDAPPLLQAKALIAAMGLAGFQGETDAQRGFGERALALSRAAGDPRLAAHALFGLGLAAHGRGDSEEATARAQECLALAQTSGDPSTLTFPLWILALAAGDRGDYERAATLHGELLALNRQAGDLWAVAINLGNLAWTLYVQGKYEQARAVRREGLALAQQICNPVSLAWGLEETGWLCGEQGQAGVPAQWVAAARLMGAAEALRERIGHRLAPQDRPYHEQHRIAARAILGEAAFAAAWAAGRVLPLDEAVAEAQEALGERRC